MHWALDLSFLSSFLKFSLKVLLFRSWNITLEFSTGPKLRLKAATMNSNLMLMLAAPVDKSGMSTATLCCEDLDLLRCASDLEASKKKVSTYFKHSFLFSMVAVSRMHGKVTCNPDFLRMLKLSALCCNIIYFISIYNNKPRASDTPAANAVRQMLCCHLATQKNLPRYQQTTDQFISSICKTPIYPQQSVMKNSFNLWLIISLLGLGLEGRTPLHGKLNTDGLFFCLFS